MRTLDSSSIDDIKGDVDRWKLRDDLNLIWIMRMGRIKGLELQTNVISYFVMYPNVSIRLSRVSRKSLENPQAT